MACSAISHNLWKLHVPQFPITLVFRIFSSSFRGLIASKWKGVVCRPQKAISDWTNHPEQVLINFQRFDFGTGFASLLFWFLYLFRPFFIGKMQTTEGVGWKRIQKSEEERVKTRSEIESLEISLESGSSKTFRLSCGSWDQTQLAKGSEGVCKSQQ